MQSSKCELNLMGRINRNIFNSTCKLNLMAHDKLKSLQLNLQTESHGSSLTKISQTQPKN